MSNTYYMHPGLEVAVGEIRGLVGPLADHFLPTNGWERLPGDREAEVNIPIGQVGLLHAEIQPQLISAEVTPTPTPQGAGTRLILRTTFNREPVGIGTTDGSDNFVVGLGAYEEVAVGIPLDSQTYYNVHPDLLPARTMLHLAIFGIFTSQAQSRNARGSIGGSDESYLDPSPPRHRSSRETRLSPRPRPSGRKWGKRT